MGETERSRKHVDYDRLAPFYDQRYAASHLDGVLSALKKMVENTQAERVLEVGCGTGYWLTGLDPMQLQRCGLDSSWGMLHQARRKNDTLSLVAGRAEEPPYTDGVFDLIFCVNAIHHFDDPRSFFRRAHRLLQPGGALAVIGSDPRGRRENWYVYEMFSGTYATDLRRFPSRDALAHWMVASGFRGVQWRMAERIVDHRTGREVLQDPFLRKDACSQLTLLTDEAYAAGMRRIRAVLADAAAVGQTIIFPTEIVLGMTVGKKSPGGTPRERMT